MLFVLACKPSFESRRTSSSAAEDASYEDEDSGDTLEGDSDVEGRVTKTTKKRRTRGSALPVTTSTRPGGDDGAGESGSRPVFNYRGRGLVHHESDRFSSTSTIVTSMSSAELRIDQTARTIDLKGKGGADEQRKVDQDIRTQSVGVTVYQKATPSERSAMSNNFPLAIYATGVRVPRGWSWKFSAPLPVFPWPGKRSRYTALDNGPVSWDATLTCTGCPKHSLAALNGPFPVTVTASKISESGGEITIKFETVINESSVANAARGTWYHGLPLPRSGTYVIDTNRGMIRSIETLHLRKRDESGSGQLSGPVENSTMLYRICSVSGSSNDGTFPCD